MVVPLIRRRALVVRRKTGHYVNGHWVQDTTSDTNTTGSIQPADKDAVEKLPEGDRSKRSISVWGEFAFLLDDLILVDGRTYEVHYIEDFTGSGVALLHREIIAVELEHRDGSL